MKALAPNLGLLKAVEELALALPGKEIILLKGGALIAEGTADIRTREMDDLDLLVRKDEQASLVSVLFQLGFQKRPLSPQDFVRDGVVFDVHSDIWYLTPGELEIFFQKSSPCPVGDGTILIPEPNDHLLFILAHACLHHSAIEPKWAEDIRRLLARGGVDLARVRSEADRLGLLPAIDWYQRRARLSLWPPGPRTWRERAIEETPYPLKGVALRLLFVRGGAFRLKLAAKTIFPDSDFLKARYDGNSRLWTVLRPLAMCAAAAAALGRSALARLGRFNPLLHGLDAEEAGRAFRETYEGPEAASELSAEGPAWEPWEKELLEGPLRVPGRLLDVGCGTGREAALFEKLGFEVTGIDPSPMMIETARRRAAEAGLRARFSVASADDFEAPAGSFDRVYFTRTLISCILGKSRRLEILRRMKRLLRPGGTLVISGYARNPSEEGFSFQASWRARRLLSRVLGGYPFEKGDAWMPVPGEGLGLFHRFAPGELAAELQTAGFKDGGGSTTHRYGLVKGRPAP